MSGQKRLFTVTALAVLIGVTAGCAGGCGMGTNPAKIATPMSTRLIIEITGGFAYVPDLPKRTLEVAYLNDVEIKDSTGKVVCAVDEIGTELTVVRGKIVTPSPPPNRTFDLDGTVVTIPALDSATTPLTYNRPIGHPSPAKPTSTGQWSNLQYVPSLKDFHPGTGIRPSWRSEVNGRVVLKGGNVVATVPTDPSIELADFEFKQGTTSKGSFAVTDKIIYTVDVPGSSVELQLSRVTGSTTVTTTVTIEPPAPGKPVRLKLHGMHGADGISSFVQGQEVHEFCAFYSLLEPKQPAAQMVKMFYNGPPPGTFALGAQPSPGSTVPVTGFKETIMNQSTLPKLARVIIIVVLASAVIIAAPIIKQVNPPATAGGNPPVVIAVLADHYAAGEDGEFDQDVENFFKYALLVDGYYEKQKNDLKIVSIFNETPPGQASIYDFKIEPGVGNCAVINAGDAVGKINAALGNLHPVHTVVLGNYPYNFGCTDGSWTYVSVDAVGTDVLQHEFGHVLAGLFDEWSTPQNKAVNYPGVIHMWDTRNCWPTRPPATKPPHWKTSGQFPKSKEFAECDLFGKQVLHAFEYCRMGTKNEHPHHPAFCDVCISEMDDTFLYYRNWRRMLTAPRYPTQAVSPQASHAPTTPRFQIVNAAFVEREREQDPPTGPIKILRFRVEINPGTGTMTVKGRTAANGVYVPSYRRDGRFAFEYVVDGKPIEVGVIPDHLFEARGFRGGAPAHRASDPHPTEVVIAIPNEDIGSIQTGVRQLLLYRIPDGLPGRYITMENFATLRTMEKPMAVVAVK